ncbi:hypothetical protein L7F22_055936 [Adiantum nelumboides]|nr:hypothetical protein [Adiantum nelumboides]
MALEFALFRLHRVFRYLGRVLFRSTLVHQVRSAVVLQACVGLPAPCAAIRADSLLSGIPLSPLDYKVSNSILLSLGSAWVCASFRGAGADPLFSGSACASPLDVSGLGAWSLAGDSIRACEAAQIGLRAGIWAPRCCLPLVMPNCCPRFG